MIKGFTLYYPVLALGLIAPVALAYPVCRRFAVGRAVFLVLGVLGQFSYEIFLFHQPLIRDYCHSLLNIFHSLDPDQIPPWLRLSGGLGFTGVFILMIFAGEKSWERLDLSVRRKISTYCLRLFTASALLFALWPLEAHAWQQCRLRFGATRSALRETLIGHPDFGGYPGPVRLRVNLPRAVGALGSPLVVTGRSGAGDIVHVRCVGPDRYVISLDHWAQPMRQSAILALRVDQPHELVISLGSLLPPDAGSGFSALKKNPVHQCRRSARPQRGPRLLLFHSGGLLLRPQSHRWQHGPRLFRWRNSRP